MVGPGYAVFSHDFPIRRVQETHYKNQRAWVHCKRNLLLRGFNPVDLKYYMSHIGKQKMVLESDSVNNSHHWRSPFGANNTN